MNLAVVKVPMIVSVNLFVCKHAFCQLHMLTLHWLKTEASDAIVDRISCPQHLFHNSVIWVNFSYSLPCFDAVGWVTGRASGL